MKKRLLFLPILVISIFISGCNGYKNLRNDVDVNHAAQSKEIEQHAKTVLVAQRSPLIQTSGEAWITARSVPLERVDNFPPQFDLVSLHFNGRHNIESISEIITYVTNIPVMIYPDVLVPVSKIASTESSSQSTQSSSGSITPISGNQLSGRSVANENYFVDVPVDYSGSLKNFLDRITSRLGLDWEYKNGRIEIRRFITRTFSVMILPGTMKTTSLLGKSGSQSGGVSSSGGGGGGGSKNGTFSSDSSVTTESEINHWVTLSHEIETMLTSMGKLSVNQPAGTITVYDTRDVVDRIGLLIEEENRVLTRQVSFEVRVLSVRSHHDSEYGIDWNLVYANLANRGNLTLQSPASLVGASAGQMGVSILKGALTGSTAFIKALEGVGKVSNITDYRATTLNRRPLPVAVTDQTTYAASTTPGTSSIGGTSSFGITPGTVTTGFMLTLFPSITDRNSLLLSMFLDISELRGMVTFSSGSGATLQSIETPRVAGTQSMQYVGLKTGETLVLTGLDLVVGNYNQRTLDAKLAPGAGGSFVGVTTKDSLVILITPVIMDGAL